MLSLAAKAPTTRIVVFLTLTEPLPARTRATPLTGHRQRLLGATVQPRGRPNQQQQPTLSFAGQPQHTRTHTQIETCRGPAKHEPTGTTTPTVTNLTIDHTSIALRLGEPSTTGYLHRPLQEPTTHVCGQPTTANELQIDFQQ